MAPFPDVPPTSSTRVRLRQFTEADAPRVLDLHSRIEVVRWLDDPPFDLQVSLGDAVAWIDRAHTLQITDPRCGVWAVEVVATGVVAGTALLAPVPNDPEEHRQIGWHLHPDSVGHGYATDAALAVRDHAFACGLDEVLVMMYPHNAPSASVARRIGLTEHGVRPDPYYSGESLMFSMTRGEHEALVGGAGTHP
ncbi:GNAT family N-acetyltransferase [Solicola sp. PLA-1-18]|uniref:GNAT family N-acetyltransferase n=1 Tax=Solicola sp. PLA-1-18 TaxID=3380532 RepID=UPI003B7D063A